LSRKSGKGHFGTNQLFSGGFSSPDVSGAAASCGPSPARIVISTIDDARDTAAVSAIVADRDSPGGVEVVGAVAFSRSPAVLDVSFIDAADVSDIDDARDDTSDVPATVAAWNGANGASATADDGGPTTLLMGGIPGARQPVLSVKRAAARPLIRTVDDPSMIELSPCCWHTIVSPTRAAGRCPMRTFIEPVTMKPPWAAGVMAVAAGVLIRKEANAVKA